jgi:hypothetical protein
MFGMNRPAGREHCRFAPAPALPDTQCRIEAGCALGTGFERKHAGSPSCNVKTRHAVLGSRSGQHLWQLGDVRRNAIASARVRGFTAVRRPGPLGE